MKVLLIKLQVILDAAKTDADAEIIIGGGHDKSVGYFIEPTVIVSTISKICKTMCTELFGPVLTVYIYEDAEWEASLKLVDETYRIWINRGNFFERQIHC